MDKEVKIGKLSYFPTINSFGPGTIFLKMSGTFDAKIPVVVSQVQKSKFSVDVETLCQAQTHSNILQFYCHEQNTEFM